MSCIDRYTRSMEVENGGGGDDRSEGLYLALARTPSSLQQLFYYSRHVKQPCMVHRIISNEYTIQTFATLK